MARAAPRDAGRKWLKRHHGVRAYKVEQHPESGWDGVRTAVADGGAAAMRQQVVRRQVGDGDGGERR